MAAVRRALAKEPGDRFRTAGEFARELQLIRRALPTTQEAAGLDETRFASSDEMRVLQRQLDEDAAAKVQPAPRSNRWWAIPLGVAALALVSITALTLGSRQSATSPSSEGANSARAASDTPAAAAAKAGTSPTAAVLQVETVPAGASVAVDGRDTRQTTPAPVTFAGAGPHTLRLSRRGFVSQEIKLTEADLSRGTLSYTLATAEVARVALTIGSPYPVEVLRGSQTLARAGASHQLSVPVGSRLRVVAREYMLDAVINVSGKAVQYNAPPLGRLTVLTKFETCNVKIGDRVVGFPPITRMPIVSGQYRVDIICQGGTNPPGQFVTVPANETVTVRIY